MLTLAERQSQMIILLKEVITILNDEKIPYSLAYGSVLGAVRHKGFIPWDEDIDLYICIDHYDIICEKLKARLPGNLKFFSKEVDSTYDEVVLRVGFANQPHQTMHIDLFPLTGCPNTDATFSRVLFQFTTYLANRCFFIKKVNPRFNYKKKTKKFFLAYFCKFLLFPIPAVFFKFLFNKLSTLYPVTSSNELFSICGGHSASGHSKDYWPKEWFTEQIFCTFEDIQLPIPKDWDAYLRNYYGDYLTPKKY